MILGEEYGEACQAGNECYFRDHPFEDLRKELIQTMAVALAIIEGLEHQKVLESDSQNRVKCENNPGEKT